MGKFPLKFDVQKMNIYSPLHHLHKNSIESSQTRENSKCFKKERQMVDLSGNQINTL